jgi:DNA-binding HxlR family transcriptional regulator
MTTINVLVKKAPSRNLVSQREPAAPPDPYAAGCPTRLLLDRIGDKWMVLTLGLIRDKPRRFNALKRDIEGVTQKMLSQTLKQMDRDGLITRTVLPRLERPAARQCSERYCAGSIITLMRIEPGPQIAKMSSRTASETIGLP